MMTCLIVDDEALARALLSSYIERLPDWELVGTCASAFEAEAILEAQSVDVLLLDIQMPQRSGIELLQRLPEPRPAVIFTTAYPNYAVEGFELNATDYLLKPFAFERLAQALEKATEQRALLQKADQYDQQQQRAEQVLWIHAEHQHHKLLLSDIHYIESLKEYVRYHTAQGRYVEHNSLKRLEETLPHPDFLRIHRSYIVALSQVQSQQVNRLLLQDGTSLPIGKTYKKQIGQYLF